MAVIVKPNLPSTVVQFVGETAISVPAAFNELVAIPFTSDWGPLGSESGGTDLVRSLSEFEAKFGTGDTPGRTAVIGAFRGSGLPGQGGAGGVIPYRLATNAAARASITLNNTGAAPAILLNAIYRGTRGNDLSVVVEDDPVDAARDRLRIRFRGATVESYSYPNADIAALVTAINARPSRWVTATQLATGVALAVTAGTSLAGGNDGAAVTAAEYAAAQTALEFKDFGVFAPAALTDPAVKVQIANWAKVQADEMRPFRVVFGGAAAETVDDAIAELAANPALRDPHVIRFAVGTYHDEVLEKDLSTAQLAPRIAGVLAARGDRAALTRSKLAALSVVGSTGASTDELVAGRDAGLTILRRISSPDADLAVSQGVTTFTATNEPARPYNLFSEPRIVGLLDGIIRRMVIWGDEVVIGDLPVNDDTRNLVRKQVLKEIGALESSGLAQPGTGFVNVDPPEDPNLLDTIPFEFGFVPSRTANYLLGYGRIR